MAHPLDDVPDQHVALPRRMRLGEHPLLAAPIAGDPHEPRRERPERLVEGLGASRQRVGAVAAPVPARDRPGGHSVAWRTISRNSAAAASPRRRGSSGGMSGTSPNQLLRRFTVTIVGFRSSLAGAGGVSGFAVPLRTMAGPSSGTGFPFPGGGVFGGGGGGG